MEWWLLLIVIFSVLLVLMASGLPVALCFMLFTLVASFFIWGGERGIYVLIVSYATFITNFNFLPILLFVLMGEVMFGANITPRLIDTVDKWVGRLPGRLGLVAVAAGTLIGTFTGSGMASAAMLGSTLLPEMKKRGYKSSMSIGPILGSAGLAVMIPPSGLAVIVGALGEISIGRLLVSIIIPGLLMAALFAVYITVRCWLQPVIAPPYAESVPPLSDKIIATVRYVLPLGFIVFLVTGVIFLGIATPTEAAATGTFGCFILAAVYKKLNWKLVVKSISSTIDIAVMVYFIMMPAAAFSQVLAQTKVNVGMIAFATNLAVPPIAIAISMIVVSLILGMFMSPTPICLVTLPLFMPIVRSLGIDPIWFGTIFILSLEVAGISPPFGLTVFVMKSVAGPDTTVDDCFRAGLPFLGLTLLAMALMFAFPLLCLWLPSKML